MIDTVKGLASSISVPALDSSSTDIQIRALNALLAKLRAQLVEIQKGAADQQSTGQSAIQIQQEIRDLEGRIARLRAQQTAAAGSGTTSYASAEKTTSTTPSSKTEGALGANVDVYAYYAEDDIE